MLQTKGSTGARLLVLADAEWEGQPRKLLLDANRNVYVSALESCAIFSKRDTKWEAGKGFGGGSSRESPDDPPRKYLRALDVRTGRTAWEISQDGPATTRGGVLATAAGLVFFCADSNEFAVAIRRLATFSGGFPQTIFGGRRQ